MRHIPFIETEPITSPPSTIYERGKWYERRGYLEEALVSFREAALSSPLNRDQGAQTDWKDSDLIWLEYGLLSMRLRSFQDAERAFRTVLSKKGVYAQEALNHWAALLHAQGSADPDIYASLAREVEGCPNSEAMLGKALNYIGSYSFAAECFSRLDGLSHEQWHMYICSLIRSEHISEALQLMRRGYNSAERGEGRKELTDRMRKQRIIQLLCERKLNHTQLEASLGLTERIEWADIAVSLGMIDAAEELLSEYGDHAYYALICLLYQEGYKSLAATKIHALEELPLQDPGVYSTDLIFVAAERLYDQGSYEESAELFAQLRSHRPSFAAARFGEAACYLQSTLISLSGRLERVYASAEARTEIEAYLGKINAALHVVESTGWHTSWSPAQQRNDPFEAERSLVN
ncbi:hypothetical protein BBD41_04430 [Paenibacillus ihbetae]|uniref:Tetratricopeptide repeat protein n=1 Tax=Paenibacillus ihbetae TaxID=1870820 RepID=A0A1B2DW30_9BACL|nr:hypothetical protein [Paenibacillus ihbetae]ANY71891.1 hypothetical protein BBD41_04430 [Paenibacillus ihbetae]